MWPWFILWCLHAVYGISDLVEEFPNPQREWRMCGRQKSSYICDPDFIMESGEVDRLDQLAQELKTSTSCLCPSCPDNTGIQIGIFVKKNFTEESSPDDRGKILAEKIRQKWSLGTCDDDIILILLTQSNISDFSLGSSVQRLLTEETAAQILNDCRIHFDSGYFYQGLESIVSSFNDVIIREQRNSSESNNELMIGILIFFAVLLFVACAAALALHFRQVKRRKMSCSNIYENGSSRRDRKTLPSDQEEQLEKLNKKSDGENEDV